VGGVQKDDLAWIETALRRHPDRILAFAPVPDPLAADAARRLDGLLARHENLALDISGMHFLRTPALASETGPLGAAWKGLLTEHAGRIMAGLDVWAPALHQPAMLDRLLTWTRRILGALDPVAAERVAHGTAVRLFNLT
jgi:hypothetical protein